jgi:hypothetical protein
MEKLTEPGWDTEPHSFSEQRTMKRGQINSLLRSANGNIVHKIKRFSAVAFFATAAAHGKFQQP